MPVEDLWPPVSTVPVFVAEVKESIAKQGLMNPIIVVRLPREDLLTHFASRALATKGTGKPSTLPDTPVINAIYGGSNRLEAVKQLGYTYVDCVLIPDFEVAMEIQERQRFAYNRSKEGDDGSAGKAD